MFGHKMTGFDRKDAILSGIESRTSSPIRIHRDGSFVGSVEGIYPCGEGAGYAGGIVCCHGWHESCRRDYKEISGEL